MSRDFVGGMLSQAFRLVMLLVVICMMFVAMPVRVFGDDVVCAVEARRVGGDLFPVETARDEELCREWSRLFDACVTLGYDVSRDAVMLRFSRLPIADVELLADSGWTMWVGHGDLAVENATNYGESVIGLCVPSEKRLYVEDTDVGLSLAIPHEMGHFVDISRGSCSRTSDEWARIFETEASSMFVAGRFDDYAAENAVEFFAEAYRMAVCYPDTARLTAPKAFEFVRGMS